MRISGFMEVFYEEQSLLESSQNIAILSCYSLSLSLMLHQSNFPHGPPPHHLVMSLFAEVASYLIISLYLVLPEPLFLETKSPCLCKESDAITCEGGGTEGLRLQSFCF